MAKILLVEDDNNLREIYEARLQAEGYEIVSAMDGEEALVVAKKEKPDLVISDVMMPRISGFEMLDILRNTDGLKEVKVIMLTALGQAEDKTRADSLGADRYLVKSQVTLEDIVKAAQELLSPGSNTSTANPAAGTTAATTVTATAGATTAAVASTSTLPAPSDVPAPTVPQPPSPVPTPPVPTPVVPDLPAPEPVVPAIPMPSPAEPVSPTPEPTVNPAPTPQESTMPNTTPPEVPQTPVEPVMPAMPPVMPDSPVPEPAAPPQVPAPAEPPTAPPTEPVTPALPGPITPPAAPAEPPVPGPDTNQPAPNPSEPAVPPVAPTPPESQPAAPDTTTPPAQSASDEEDAIKAQIESFVNQNNQTAPGSVPSSTPQTSETSEAEKDKPEPATNNDFMADAIKGLVSDSDSDEGEKPQSLVGEKTIQPPSEAQSDQAKTAPSVVSPTATEPGTPPAEPEKQEDDNDSDNVGVAHKKIISPISNAEMPQSDLNALLAKEGLSGMDDLHQDNLGGPSPTNPVGLPTTPHPPGHVISPNQGPGGVDPNSIAL